MTWQGFIDWLAGWLRHDETRFDGLHHDLVFVSKQIYSLHKELGKMSQQTDALTAEVEQLVKVLASSAPLIDAAIAAETQLASLVNGGSIDNQAVASATEKLAAAREAFSAEVGKLSPAAGGK